MNIAPEYQQVIPLLALDRTIAYNVAFRKVAGSTVAAVFLSQAWHWTKTEVAQSRDGWFYKEADDWTEETGLSRKEQTTARKHLKEKGILEEERRGIDPTLWYRVNGEALAAAIRDAYQGTLPIYPMGKQVIADQVNSYSPNGEIPHITKMTTERTAETTSQGDTMFDEFWRVYPRKEGKAAAKKAWKGATAKLNVMQILDSLERQINNNWQGREKQYIPLPASWLNGERWDDEIVPYRGNGQQFKDSKGNLTAAGLRAFTEELERNGM